MGILQKVFGLERRIAVRDSGNTDIVGALNLYFASSSDLAGGRPEMADRLLGRAEGDGSMTLYRLSYPRTLGVSPSGALVKAGLRGSFAVLPAYADIHAVPTAREIARGLTPAEAWRHIGAQDRDPPARTRPENPFLVENARRHGKDLPERRPMDVRQIEPFDNPRYWKNNRPFANTAALPAP